MILVINEDTYLTIASDGGSAYAQGIKLIHHDPNYGWRIRGDDTDDCFHINRITADSNNASALTITKSRQRRHRDGDPLCKT